MCAMLKKRKEKKMSTPHNEAAKTEIASIVLMPGDPLRAKYIADQYLKNVRQFNRIRNMYGYTGEYKGKKISVMGSGMGIPSIGIYSYELFKVYGVDAIIRIGSCGSYDPDLHVYDLILAKAAYSESKYALIHNGDSNKIQYPDPSLNALIQQTAHDANLPLRLVSMHSSDVFYSENDSWVKKAQDLGCSVVEMESFGLFHNAKALNKKAACLCTVSDSLVYGEAATWQEREQNFDQMVLLALESALRFH